MIQNLEYFPQIMQNNFLLGIIISLIAGLVASFNPCMISTISLIIGYLSIEEKNIEVKSNKKYNNLKYSFFFSLGLIIVLVILALIFSILGNSLKIFGRYWYLILAVIMILVTFKLFNVFPNSENKYCKIPKLTKNPVNAFLVGVIGGVLNSPCSSPALITILVFISNSNDMLKSIMYILTYSIGNCIVLILVGISADLAQKLFNDKRYEKISEILKNIFGCICLVIALYLFYMFF